MQIYEWPQLVHNLFQCLHWQSSMGNRYPRIRIVVEFQKHQYTPEGTLDTTLNMQHSCWHLWCSIMWKNPPQSTISKNNNGMLDSLFFTQSSTIGHLWVYGEQFDLLSSRDQVNHKQNKRDTTASVSVSKACSFVASMSCHGDSTGTAIAVVEFRLQISFHAFRFSDLSPTYTSTKLRYTPFIVKLLIWSCPHLYHICTVLENKAKLISKMKVLWLITANWLFHFL